MLSATSFGSAFMISILSGIASQSFGFPGFTRPIERSSPSSSLSSVASRPFIFCCNTSCIVSVSYQKPSAPTNLINKPSALEPFNNLGERLFVGGDDNRGLVRERVQENCFSAFFGHHPRVKVLDHLIAKHLVFWVGAEVRECGGGKTRQRTLARHKHRPRVSV